MLSGRGFVILEYCPIMVGGDDRAHAGVKQFPVDETLLPET